MKIYISCSNTKSDKTVSTGFKPTMYESLDDLANAMMKNAHSPSIYSSMTRWDKYKKDWVVQRRRRLHNISLIGNILAYDFDDGSLSFKQAKKLAKKIFNDTGYPILIIRSKSDPKYKHDRFKMLVVTNFLYPIYKKDKVVPKDFERVPFNDYLDVYVGFAKKHGFYEKMDKSTMDATRLIAQVTTDKKEDKRREYVIISK